MATPQLSPGVLVREVDLTVGRADNVLDNIGAIAGPFEIGPVNEPIDISTEADLINVFGKPLSTDTQYEYWMSASSFLSYGGVLKVVRVAGSTLANANAGVNAANATLTGASRIDNYDDYTNNHSEATNFTYAAKTPGSWANGLKVCFIDDKADQTIGITTTNLSTAGATIGAGVTAALVNVVVPSVSTGTTAFFNGYLKGIITGVSTDTVSGNSAIDVKIVSRVETSGAGVTETKINYAEGTAFAAFDTSDSLFFVNSAGVNTGGSATAAYTPSSVSDWYDNQTLALTNSTTYWKEIAPKPISNVYATDRQSKNDALHIVIVDDNGTVSGIKGNILEKHISLSKAKDAISNVNSPQKIWYEQYLADFSQYVYAGGNPSSAIDTYHNTIPVATGFTTYSGVKSASFTPIALGDRLWGQDAQGITFTSIGNTSYSLAGGVDYSANGGMKAELSDLITAYGYFQNSKCYKYNYSNK
jgi:hypothetical protein